MLNDCQTNDAAGHGSVVLTREVKTSLNYFVFTTAFSNNQINVSLILYKLYNSIMYIIMYLRYSISNKYYHFSQV